MIEMQKTRNPASSGQAQITTGTSLKTTNLVWNVICQDDNRKRIDVFNVFDHVSFKAEVKKHLKRCETKEKFAVHLRSLLLFFFRAKSEWEIVIQPLLGGGDIPEKKVDVYWQVMNNWDIFLEYVWNSKFSKGSRCS